MISKREMCVKLAEQAREWVPVSTLRAVSSTYPNGSYSTYICPVCRSMCIGMFDSHIMHLQTHSDDDLKEAYLVAELGG